MDRWVLGGLLGRDWGSQDVFFLSFSLKLIKSEISLAAREGNYSEFWYLYSSLDPHDLILRNCPNYQMKYQNPVLVSSTVRIYI